MIYASEIEGDLVDWFNEIGNKYMDEISEEIL